MKYGVYYHWWDVSNGVEPYRNLQSPILPSIASLRANNPDIPITVLMGKNRSDRNDWLDFPEKLNFTVKPIEFRLEKDYRQHRGWRHLSRIFDLEIHAQEDIVIYCDADVFWFKDPLPLLTDTDKFGFNGNNTGFLCYNRHSHTVQRFFEIFKAFTLSAMNDDDIRKLMKTHVGYDPWYFVFDEMICTYMFHGGHRDLFSQIPLEEHCCPRDFGKIDIHDMKMLHCNGLMVNNRTTEAEHARGLVPLIFSELCEKIASVLDPTEIYSEEELEYYLPRQFSLLERYQEVMATRASDGHYLLDRCLDGTRFML